MTSSRFVVTGAAGFVGSAIAERLIADGADVTGVDCLTDYYSPKVKRSNLEKLLASSRFRFIERNILEIDWPRALDGVEAVFHQAAQAGVRASWGASFRIYTELNVLSTQVLLEAVKESGARMVYASSSSVYGDSVELPMREDHRPRPYSPYGVTKLAAEHLCGLYSRNFGVPTVSLRYFTVYGPRQRPDMAFHRFIKAGLTDQPITLYGDGEQTRDFTFIDDIVEANLAAAARGKPGGVYNIGGGSTITVNDALKKIEAIVGKPLRIDRQQNQKGDVRHTLADTSRAREELGWKARTGLDEGLAREAAWVENLLPLLV